MRTTVVHSIYYNERRVKDGEDKGASLKKALACASAFRDVRRKGAGISKQRAARQRAANPLP